jgi:pimeloyl-ACP methyl ester carboxylesterase
MRVGGGIQRLPAALLVALAAVSGGCTSAENRRATQTPSPSPSVDRVGPSPSPTPTPAPKVEPSPAGPKPRLAHAAPCSVLEEFTCSTLQVPLDHSNPTGPKLKLQVADSGGSPRRDVLLFLTGGPGQTGVAFAPIVADDLAPLLDDWRLVLIDQRGTGERAIECPDLQNAVGASDILTAPTSAVKRCAKIVGDKRPFYTTSDTVADLDLLRRAMKVDKWVVDGVSYGTFVAQRYAIAYPDHAQGLVLDSVVPPDGLDTFLRVNLRRVAYVLRDVCRDDPPCVSDPAKDLARIVRQDLVDNVDLLNGLTLQSIVDPTFREMADVPGLLVQGRAGDTEGLDDYIERFRAIGAFTADQLSAGSHVATLCADLKFPWGDAATPLKGRRAPLVRAVREIEREQVWPFDAETAAGHGMIRSCLHWTPADTELQLDAAELPNVPVLMLNGERDLSTPMAWAHKAARMWPDARLVEIPNDGHSIQTDGLETVGGRALIRFLRDL